MLVSIRLGFGPLKMGLLKIFFRSAQDFRSAEDARVQCATVSVQKIVRRVPVWGAAPTPLKYYVSYYDIGKSPDNPTYDIGKAWLALASCHWERCMLAP